MKPAINREHKQSPLVCMYVIEKYARNDRVISQPTSSDLSFQIYQRDKLFQISKAKTPFGNGEETAPFG
jgi:hypothetical protein